MFVLLTALLSRKFVSFVANHVDTKLFGGKARSRFRDLVVELEAELEAEQKARRVRKELGGNPFAGHAMAARTEDGRRRSGRNRAAPARYGVESTTTSEESESEDEDEVSSSSSGGEGSGDEAGSQRADADFSGCTFGTDCDGCGGSQGRFKLLPPQSPPFPSPPAAIVVILIDQRV